MIYLYSFYNPTNIKVNVFLKSINPEDKENDIIFVVEGDNICQQSFVNERDALVDGGNLENLRP